MTFPFKKSKKAPLQVRNWLRENQPVTERSWGDLKGNENDSLRTRLYTDQHGLCCYCYVRIADDHTSHIEHVEPQSN